ncbi:hypothetical protein TREAZ_0452 [Leadbettera azotonutricia ZAS-9]|uniref:Uncharacterized protein n=1 Tax=Leadbettera azotonutricia (strain ATCC BAA-888 / DSM 13862 / ZAS-9) TaxID=545695 RepID=F5YCS4_LEAAZ|nr:hypothetical protein TREAZ_0452 [Leadbettera azotonutricia ZAS-9]
MNNLEKVFSLEIIIQENSGLFKKKQQIKYGYFKVILSKLKVSE